MGILDNLNGAFNDQSRQIDPQQMQSLSQLLAQFQAGQGGNEQDYQKLMQSYNPKPRKQDILGDLGDTLVQSAKANPQNNSFATIGDALSGLRSKRGTEQDAQQAQYQKSLADMIKIAATQREMGQKDTSEANKVDYQNRNLASDDAYRRGMLGMQQQQLNEGRFIPLGQDAEGNAIVMNAKTGETVNQGKMTLGRRGGGGMGGGTGIKTTIPVGMQAPLDKAIDTIIGAKGIDGKPVKGVSPLDPELKKELSAEAAQLILDGDAASADDAVMQIMKKRGGVGALQEITKKGLLWGRNNTGFRNFGGPSIPSGMGGGNGERRVISYKDLVGRD